MPILSIQVLICYMMLYDVILMLYDMLYGIYALIKHKLLKVFRDRPLRKSGSLILDELKPSLLYAMDTLVALLPT